MASTDAYQVGVQIGEGSFGVTVHGRHKDTNMDVAIKAVDKASLRKRTALKKALALKTEQKILKQVAKECPYAINLLASFHDSECVYLVMECCTGGTLQDVLTYGRTAQHEQKFISSNAVGHYSLQVLEGLSFLHSRKVIHCDIKPDNLLLTEKGQVRIGDFGCAVDLVEAEQRKKARKAPENNSAVNQQTAEQNGPSHQVYFEDTPKGTAGYACPTLMRAAYEDDADLPFAVDLWSFGCVCFALLTGKSPFDAPSEALMVQKVALYAENAVDAPTRQNILFFPTTDVPALCCPTEKKENWKALITGLLDPSDSTRLGSADLPTGDTFSSYNSLRSKGCWNEVDLSKTPEFLPEKPSWWQKAQLTEMKDGKLGWSAFLM